jgi:hypothetical protein
MPAARVSKGAAKRETCIARASGDLLNNTRAWHTLLNINQIRNLCPSQFGPFSSEQAPNLEGRLLIHKPAQPDAVH